MDTGSLEIEIPATLFHWFIPLPEALQLPLAPFVAGYGDDGEYSDDPVVSISLFPLFVKTDYPSPNMFDIAHLALDQSRPEHHRIALDDTVPGNRPPFETTVIEAVAVFHGLADITSEQASWAFDRALEQIQKLQQAFYLATKYPTPLVTRQQLPGMIPFLRRSVTDTSDGFPGEEGIYLVHANSARAATLTEALTKPELQSYATILREPPRPFYDYADLRRDAVVALEYYGNYRDAVLTAATASEVFLDTLLISLDWEDRKTPEETASTFDQYNTISRRVRTLYGPRLKGKWNTAGDDPVARWYQDCMALRNLVVHGGQPPSLEQTRQALAAVDGLETFVADQLTKPNTLQKYLHTAYAFVGYPGLDRRGLLSKRLRSQLEQIIESRDWIDQLGRYRKAVSLERERRTGALPDPDPASGRLHLVIREDGAEQWVIWDESTGQAAVVKNGEGTISRQARQTLSDNRQLLHELAKFAPQVLECDPVSSLKVTDGWTADYRLLPTLSVIRQ